MIQKTTFLTFKCLRFFVAFIFLSFLNLKTSAQTTETFSTVASGVNTFTSNSQNFTITTLSNPLKPFGGDLEYPGTGWNGTSNDNGYIDNDGGTHSNPSFSIKTTDGTDFTANKVFLFFADQSLNQAVSGTLNIVGKKDGAAGAVFTINTSSGYVTTTGTNNGFTEIDFTSYGGSDNSSTVIDELIFTMGGSFQYIALDAFTWTLAPTDAIAPRISSIARQSPTTSPTNADALVWDVTFDEAVSNVDATDFTVTGTTATIASVTNPSGNVYRITASGGDLAGLNATATLGFAGTQNITDASANALVNYTPTGTNNNTFVVDNNSPTTPTTVTQNTSDLTPTITGTNALGTALPTGETMTVTVNGATYNVVPNGSGNWSVDTGVATPASGTLGTFVNGVSYEVVATVTDLASNTASDATSNEVTIDTSAPTAPTVVVQTTSDATPTITGTNALGTALPVGETMTVTVNGATYNVVPGGSGNWSLDTGVATPASGTLGTFVNSVSYEVVSTVTDLAGNNTSDATNNEVTIDTSAPTAPTVVVQTTSDLTPTITGTNALGTALPIGETMTVTVNGATYNVVPGGSGNWSLDTGVATPASGTLGTFVNSVSYEVVSTVTDLAGNNTSDATNNEVTIDTSAPTAPTVVVQTTSDLAPTITGTNALGTALPVGETMTVTVNGATYNVVPGGSGNWSLDTGVATPASGTLGTFVNSVSYEVVSTVTDLAGNNTSDATNNEVTIDTIAPLISSITRQSPTTSPTDADALAWDVTFNGAVTNVDATDFTVSGTTATIASVTNPSGNVYRVTASGGDLAGLNATVTLGFAGGQNIADASGNGLVNLTPTGTNNNTFVVDNTPPVYTWTGAFNSAWNTTLNWNPTSVPPTNADIIIPGGLTNYPTASAAVTCNSLTINSGASFIPQSTVTGTVTYKRNLPTTGDWYLVSSPIANETLQNVIANNTFATGATPGNIGIGLYQNNNASQWAYATAGLTGNIIPGIGLSVQLATAGELISTGTALNTSNVIFGISTGTTTNFNLLGNPFTAFINSATFATTNTAVLTEETVWLWNGTAYVTYNNASPIEVAPGQAFFVEASTGGAVIFATANRSHQNADTFMREAPKSTFELSVEEGTNKSATKVFYANSKTTGFDNGYDSKMFGGTDYKFKVYTELVSDSKGKKLAIQTLPNQNLETMIIPVGLIAEAGKKITFSVKAQNLPDNTNVFLEDRINNTLVNISEENHSVTLKSAAKGTGQFYIHTSAKNLEDVDITKDLQNVSIYKSANNSLTVAGLQTDKASVNVYSILGKKVISTELKSTGVHVIQLPKTAAGVYIVELSSSLGKISKKIILE